MAATGDWLTPFFLGRPALYKTPLLYWQAAAAIRLFGPTRFAIRLPSLLSVSLCVTLVFLWLWRTVSLPLACAGALLALSNHALFVFGRVGLMDSLLVACMTAALFLLDADPRLERLAVFWGFAAFAALAVLAKSVAGLIAPLILLVFCVLSPVHPSLRRLSGLAIAVLLLVAPWFIYQLTENRAWFLAEFWQRELIGYGANSPEQTSAENAIFFYLKRLWALDPFLVVLAALAMPGLRVVARRTGDHQPALLASWLLVAAGVLFLFSYRSASYLLPLFPALALIAAGYAPRPLRRYLPMLALLLLGLKLTAPSRTWGLPFSAEAPNPAAPALEQYCEAARSTGLFIVQPDDQFYATLLDLPRVRYVYLRGGGEPADFELNFEKLGVSVTVDEFLHWRNRVSEWRNRLRALGVTTDEPLASVIRASDADALAQLIAAQPAADFSLPEGLLSPDRFADSHEVWRPQPGRVFLIAKKKTVRCVPARCRV
jgi:hypothetical protein